MTIDDLAKECGIGKGSVYLHFESKEDIALSHVDGIVEKLKGELRELASGRTTVENRLKKMLIRRVMARFDSVQHYSQSLNELLASVRPRLLERRKHYFESEARIFAEVISEGKSEGVIASKNSFITASTIIDATNALLPYSLSAYELGDREELVTKANNLADLLLNGLKKR
jgi:AcrR family transcriptional regulator